MRGKNSRQLTVCLSLLEFCAQRRWRQSRDRNETHFHEIILKLERGILETTGVFPLDEVRKGQQRNKAETRVEFRSFRQR